MIKAPIDLQDLRPRLYVKAKTETSWRLTAPRLRLAAVASPMAIPAVAGSGANMLSLINLEMKCAGTRSAGNPHAACDVAGAGNGITNIPRRARRGKPRIQTRDVLSGYRASSRPYSKLVGKFGDRYARVIQLKRRKKQPSVVTVVSAAAGVTTRRCCGYETCRLPDGESTWSSNAGVSDVRGAAACM